MTHESLREFLEQQYHLYNTPDFIINDPVSVPHKFTKLQDIEIIGFWTAILAWGQRVTIINKANELIQLMENAPFDFIVNHEEKHLKRFKNFKHRTFNYTDTLYFIHVLKKIYTTHKSLEETFLFSGYKKEITVENMLINFHNNFFDDENAPHRTKKHVPTPASKSTCKRLNMFLRWMVRKDDKGGDFGVWNSIRPDQLICPLDVHVDRIARKLKLIDRKQNDWQTAKELTLNLKKFDASDPVKYDFALFGSGVMEKNGMIF